MGKKSAFSLAELMVAAAIVGILVMLAIPRYQAFMVKARRGEAKSNLSHLVSLQATYKIDYFSYYHGQAMTGINGIGYREGLPPGHSGVHGCNPLLDEDKGLCNYLGFQPDAVGELRYLYKFRGSAAIASAASDYDNYYIYPDCRGRGRNECGYTSGDAVRKPIKGGPAVVCRNITKYCPQGVGGSGIPTCPSCPPGEVSVPYPICCRPCGNCMGRWSPSPPVWAPPTAGRCSRDSFSQTATVTQNWSPPAACPSLPCPGPSTRVLRQAARGDVAPTCVGANPNPECPCISGDTRPCCTPVGAGCGSSTTGCSSPSDWTLADPTFVPANKWECDNTTKSCTLTTTYTPHPPCPPPDSTTVVENVLGEKKVNCNNLCGAYGATSWGPCGRHISGDCHRAGSATRTCIPNPCPDIDIFCNTTKTEVQSCNCPDPVCVVGGGTPALDGMTVDAARNTCMGFQAAETDPTKTWEFSTTPNGSDFNCFCKRLNYNDSCRDDNNNIIPVTGPPECQGYTYIWPGWPECRCKCNPVAESACTANSRYEWLGHPQCGCRCKDDGGEDACSASGGNWVGYPDCDCAEVDGTFTVEFAPSCVQGILDTSSQFMTDLLTDAGFDQSMITNRNLIAGCTPTLTNPMPSCARPWGELLTIIRCGAPGTVAHANQAEADSLSMEIRGCSSDTSHTTRIKIEYTCS